MSTQLTKQTILIVDDAPENIDLLNVILSQDYKIKVALNGEKAIEIASDAKDLPDLILLDVMLPGMDGYAICRHLKTDDLTRKIPIIFISALGTATDEKQGFDVGGVDYITKPVVAATVRARVKTHLALYDQNRALEEKVRERTEELLHTQDATIIGFSTLAEFRDQETGAHITRTKQYVFILAQYLTTHPRFQGYLNENTVELIHRSAPLHDIGKIAVPDRILLKPGPLTPEEFEIMKKHTWHGYNAIQRAEQALGNTQSSFLRIAKEIALTHHEKWNGKGYPRGLAGENIPISGRLMALADVYDALTSKRIYKDAASHQDALDIILAERGKHFDPDIVDAFAGLADIFKNIAQNITDDT